MGEKIELVWHILMLIGLGMVGFWFFGWLGLFALLLPYLADMQPKVEKTNE